MRDDYCTIRERNRLLTWIYSCWSKYRQVEETNGLTEIVYTGTAERLQLKKQA